MLSIPEPCNEDFSKMTPTQRGAFCSKCQIDTFDFRDLSNHEINTILLKNKGNHLCGQFKTSQMEELNAGFLEWKNQKSATFRSKFLLALIFVFGLTLFSCETEAEKELIKKYGLELSVAPAEKVRYVNEIHEVAALDLTEHIEGIISVAEPTHCNLEPVVVQDELQEVMILNRITAGMPRMLGGAVTDINYITYLEDTLVPVEEESILPNPLIIDPDYFEINSYPNPTNNDATLSIDVKFEGQFEIILYDMNGRLIRDIYSGELVTGRQTFPIELATEQSGVFIVSVLSRDQKEILKIQKLN